MKVIDFLFQVTSLAIHEEYNPLTKTHLRNIPIDISAVRRVKEETKKSTRQRTRGIKVEGKPSTINSRRRQNWSSTRRRRSNHKACSWRNRDSLRSKTKSIYNQTTLPQPRSPQTISTKILQKESHTIDLLSIKIDKYKKNNTFVWSGKNIFFLQKWKSTFLILKLCRGKDYHQGKAGLSIMT